MRSVALIAGMASFAAAEDIKLLVLQRMTDVRTTQETCDASNWFGNSATNGEQRCWLGDAWKAVATTGLAAVEHFNNRVSTYVPEFANLGGCDKQIAATVLDSGSMGTPSVKALLTQLSSGNAPDAIIGPSRSAASMPTATLAGVENIPQISYWATSAKLDSLDDYPRFMRTIPTDDAVAFSVCQFWASDMGYTKAAIIHSNDGYGEAYKESVVNHCLSAGIVVSVFSYDASDKAAIASQVRALAATDLRVVLWVGSDQGIGTVMSTAFEQGLLSAGKGALWVFTDGAGPDTIAGSAAAAATAPADAVSGAVRILAVGGTAENARYTQFVSSGFQSLDPAALNQYLPAEWQVDAAYLSSYDAAGSGNIRDIGTYEYDAVAAVGLLACQVAPTGPLPATFGTDLWRAKQGLEFQGLSGVVKFTAEGNRDLATASYQLSNVMVDAAGVATATLRAKYAGDAWRWEGGARAQSGLVFMGEATDDPPDVWMPELSVNHNYLPTGLVYAAWAVNFVFYALGVFFAIWTFRHREQALIIASQPAFLYLIILGSFISLAAVFPLSMDHNGLEPQEVGANATGGVYPSLDTACNLQVWLYTVGFVLSFGSLFGKLWRVKRVLVNPSLRNVKISVGSLMLRILALLLLEVAILLSWALADPLYFQVEVDARDKYGRITESHGHCVTGETGLALLFTLIALNLVLLVYGNLLVYQARSVPTKYNEGKYISFCVANNLQTTLFAVLLALFIYDTPIAFFIIKWMAVLACDAGTLLLIFAPKLILAKQGHGLGDSATQAHTCARVTSCGTAVEDKYATSGGSVAPSDELLELKQECSELREQLARLKEEKAEGRTSPLPPVRGASHARVDPGP